MSALLDSDQPRAWYASKGVVGPLVAAACAVLTAAGVTLKAPPQDVTDAIVTLAPIVVGAVAAIVGLVGRITATKRIGPAKPDVSPAAAAIMADIGTPPRSAR